MFSINDADIVSKLTLAKQLYEAGKISWAVTVVEEDVLGDRYTALSDKDKQIVHTWLYKGGVKNVADDKELFDMIADNVLPRAGEAIAVGL